MMPRIAILGANGFIGRNLTRTMAADGYSVTAVTRQPLGSAQGGGDIENRVVADMQDVSALAEAMQGAKYVVHLADRATRKQAHGAVNTSPAQRMDAVGKAMKACGIEKLIYASTVYARLFEEGFENGYGRQKYEAERLALTDEGIQPIILRLFPVYGEGCGGGFAVLRALVSKGFPLPLAGLDSYRDYLSITNLEDLVRAILALREEEWPAISGTTFEPSDGSPVSTAELARLLADAMGKTSRLFALPKGLLALIAQIGGKSEAFHAAADPLLARDDGKLMRLLAWKAAEQMPQTLSFVRHSG